MFFRRPLWVFSIIVSLMVPAAGAQPSLGTASSFVVLGTSAGNSGGTIVTGNIGASAGAVTGFPAPFVAGEAFTDATARQAHDDALAAYTALAAGVGNTPATLKGSVTVAASVYHVTSSLVVESKTQMHLAGDATSSTVFWVVDGDVTVGARSSFIGTILARGSITFGRDVSLSGRALALGGPVTADTDDLTLCCDPLDITPPPSAAPVGKPLAPATLQASGGTEPYAFTLFDGALPPGLTLLGDGTLTGTPTTAGTYTATARASDAHGCSSLLTFDINICGPTVLPEIALHATMCETFEATVANGTFAGNLPAGIAHVNGKLAGTPTQCGDFFFSISSTDANGCTSTQPYRLHVACAIAPAPPPLPNGTIGHSYKADISPICGVGPFIYELIKGPLPGGLTETPLPLITGVPKKPGTYPFTVKITGTSNSTTEVDYTITVVCDALTFSPAVLPSGNTCDAYNQTIAVSGGLPPYTFDVTGLPQILDFAPKPPPSGNAVTISGLPAQNGVFDVVLRATDAAGCTAMWNYRLTITKPSALTILPPTLPPAHFLEFYSQKLSTTCGVPPIQYAITIGTPPAGINLCSPDTICGTPPLTALSSKFTVSAVDKLGTAGSREYTICMPITILPETLPDAIADQPYNPPSFTATGGAGPFTFKFTPPVPAAGLSAGVYDVEITAIDTPTGCSGTLKTTLTVVPAPPLCGEKLRITSPTTVQNTILPLATLYAAYGPIPLGVIGGTGPYQFRAPVSPELPPGVTLSSGGVFSGIPTVLGHYNVAVIAKDVNGFESCAVIFTIEVLP
jgi:hypothetical protein